MSHASAGRRPGSLSLGLTARPRSAPRPAALGTPRHRQDARPSATRPSSGSASRHRSCVCACVCVCVRVATRVRVRLRARVCVCVCVWAHVCAWPSCACVRAAMCAWPCVRVWLGWSGQAAGRPRSDSRARNVRDGLARCHDAVTPHQVVRDRRPLNLPNGGERAKIPAIRRTRYLHRRLSACRRSARASSQTTRGNLPRIPRRASTRRGERASDREEHDEGDDRRAVGVPVHRWTRPKTECPASSCRARRPGRARMLRPPGRGISWLKNDLDSAWAPPSRTTPMATAPEQEERRVLVPARSSRDDASRPSQ